MQKTSKDYWEKKKKKKIVVLFSFICNVPKKKFEIKRKERKFWNNFYFLFFEIFMSRDWAKPSSHWAMIWPSQAEIKVIKPKSEPLSRNLSHHAVIQAKPSWAESFELYFITKLKVSLKLHIEFEREC